ncbi:unnamed protein product [Pleuronectes platessa]|uniref:Uncharacterized protein n=1 Tax=Pleuronectes platessa TaxID=8262 RepID=A0A9N7TKA3_PLEPL|nr:unnamed protein product [Pleuronectes platessa]
MAEGEGEAFCGIRGGEGSGVRFALEDKSKAPGNERKDGGHSPVLSLKSNHTGHFPLKRRHPWTPRCTHSLPELTPGQRPYRSHSNPSPRPTSKSPDYREEKNGATEGERQREREREQTGWKYGDERREGRKEGGQSQNGNISCLSLIRLAWRSDQLPADASPLA